MKVRYQLKNKFLRETIDLTEYKTVIIKSIHEVIDMSIKVHVMPRYYEIESNITCGIARKIGERISYNCPEIRNLRKTYKLKNDGVSNQIFVRVKDIK